MLTFIKKIITSQKKIYITIALVLTILSSLEFTLIAMYASNSEVATTTMISIICTMTLFVSCFITLFINNYFVDSKTEEFSIILLSGRNLKQILKYIIIQFGTLFMGSACIGAGLGIGIINVINLFISANGAPLFQFSLNQTFFVFISYIIIKIIYIFLLNFGKFITIKLDIAKYMNHTVDESSKPNYFSSFAPLNIKNKKKFPIGKFLETILAIYILYACFTGIMSHVDVSTMVMYFAFSLCAEIFILNSTIPLLFDILHDRFLLKHPILLLGMSQLMNLSKIMISLININALVIPMMFIILFLEYSTPLVEAVITICFFILIIIMLLSFIFRFAIYIPTKARDIATLKALGYKRKQIYQAQHIEIFFFILFVIGLPFITYSTILYQGYALQYIGMQTIYLLLVAYLSLCIILSGYMIINYGQLTKEVLLDVKYLNRSE